jgi:hypothetical protein
MPQVQVIRLSDYQRASRASPQPRGELLYPTVAETILFWSVFNAALVAGCTFWGMAGYEVWRTL